MRRLEAIADAVKAYYRYDDPESEAYELRNPGMLKAHPDKKCKFNLEVLSCERCRPEGGKRIFFNCEKCTTEGTRIFKCHEAGYRALIKKVQECLKERPDASIAELLDSLGIKMKQQQQQTVDLMARCSNSQLKADTRLNLFIEDENGTPACNSR